MTFQEERYHYEQMHRSRVVQLEKQIVQKNQIIQVLTNDLKNTNKELEKSNKENDNYRKIVAELKKEFFKMGNVVSKINTNLEIGVIKT